MKADMQALYQKFNFSGLLQNSATGQCRLRFFFLVMQAVRQFRFFPGLKAAASSAPVLFLLLSSATHLSAQESQTEVYDCIRQAETVEQMNVCGDNHIDYWRNRMGNSYSRLSGMLTETRQIMLEDAQDSWNDYRTRQTDLSNAIHYSSDDVMNRVLAKIREARLYQQRAEFLDDLIEIQLSVAD